MADYRDVRETRHMTFSVGVLWSLYQKSTTGGQGVVESSCTSASTEALARARKGEGKNQETVVQHRSSRDTAGAELE